VLGLLGISPEKQIVRPYVTAIADTVFVKKHDPCERMTYKEINVVKDKVKSDREFIAKMYYYQKAMLTKEQKLRAEDDMASDSAFKRFTAGY
jgi:hypothetical protein